MQDTSIVIKIVTLSFFCSAICSFFPDKTSSKWLAMLCACYMLMSLITSAKTFSANWKDYVFQVDSPTAISTTQITDTMDSLFEQSLEKKITDYISTNYGIKPCVECDVLNGDLISIEYDDDMEESIIADVNKLFLSEFEKNRMDNYD